MDTFFTLPSLEFSFDILSIVLCLHFEDTAGDVQDRRRVSKGSGTRSRRYRYGSWEFILIRDEEDDTVEADVDRGEGSSTG